MSNAEVITTLLVAAYFFGGNIEHAKQIKADKDRGDKQRGGKEGNMDSRHYTRLFLSALQEVYVGRDHTRKQFYIGVKLGIIALPASAHDLNLLKIFYHETKETKGATIICSSLKPYPFHSPFPSSHSHG